MQHTVTDGHFADVAPDIRLHYLACGAPQAPLLLFVHGFPEAGFAWEHLMPAFADDWYVVAPDLRGYHRSSKPAGAQRYAPRELVGDIRSLIRALGRESATIVAHDWGGAVCWNVAIRAPQVVDKLVILNSPHPYLFARALATDPAQQAASQYMNWLRKPGSEAQLAADDHARMDGFFTAYGQTQDWYTPALRARYHAMWGTPGEAGEHPLSGAVNYYRASPLHPAEPGQPVNVPALDAADWQTKVPVRVIWAEADRALPPSLLDGLSDVCSDLRVQRIADAGHWVAHEKPDAVREAIGRALKD